MTTDAMDEQYLTYDGRLASFQKSKNRRSTTTGRAGGKALNWPHKKISPESLAQSGFFFSPTADNPDNVECFLCCKNMDGWEDGDDPISEHVKHSPSCGWAIVASIEVGLEEFKQEDPSHPNLVQARKATFADRWPHDGKRGWKCKTKQLVDAGWKYTPTPDSDDMATCTYCALALDGWEPGDKPLDEHYKRSPDCLFFTHPNKGTAKKAGRSKAARGSKASRLSTQSVATAMSEAPSAADMTMTIEDSIMTTTSTRAQTGKKPRAKKATATKGRKTKAKKEETPEAEEMPEVQTIESPVAPPPAKAARGKKRASDAMDESNLTATEAPVPKKRATKTRESVPVENSVVEAQKDEEMPDVVDTKKPAPKKRGRVASGKPTRKASARVTSAAKKAPRQTLPGEFPDDDEIERQLQADLERPLTDDEEFAAGSDSEQSKAKTKVVEARRSSQKSAAVDRRSATFAMFNPAPMEPNVADLEDELNALQAEMEGEEPESQSQPELEQLQVPKKGRKVGARKASEQTKARKPSAQTRKASKQTKPAKKEPTPPPPSHSAQPAVPIDLEEDELQGEQDVSLRSTDTVITKVVPEVPVGASPMEALPVEAPPKKGRGRPRKVSQAAADSVDAVEVVEVPKEPPRKRGRPSKASLASRQSLEVVEAQSKKQTQKQPEEQPEKQPERQSEEQLEEQPVVQPKKRGRPRKSATPGNETTATVEVNETAPPMKSGRGRTPKRSSAEVAAQLLEEAEAAASRVDIMVDDIGDVSEAVDILPTSPLADDDELEPPETSLSLQHRDALAPSTPGAGISPSASARQAALSPSQSPQSSDAENQPPSSKPAGSAKRMALASMAATPMRGSPSKRNVLAGLQSNTAWTAVDLDAVLGTPRSGAGKENGVDRFLRKGQELTSPEKRMTVEEWVYFNANEAENMLKQECETMVTRFESEGTKAMNVLEGLLTEE